MQHEREETNERVRTDAIRQTVIHRRNFDIVFKHPKAAFDIRQGRTFRSLSQIAREITGSLWSGPLFFGLVQKDKGAKKRGRKAKATGKATATGGCQ